MKWWCSAESLRVYFSLVALNGAPVGVSLLSLLANSCFSDAICRSKEANIKLCSLGRPLRPGSHYQTFDDHLATKWLHPMGHRKKIGNHVLRQKRRQRIIHEQYALDTIIFDRSRGARAWSGSVLMFCFFSNVFHGCIIQGDARITSNRKMTLPEGCQIECMWQHGGRGTFVLVLLRCQ